MLLLAIESTCDETAAAVIRDGPRVVSSVVASQEALHAEYGGVVPEIAARAHTERILPVVDRALREAGVRPRDLAAVAAATSPGLAGSLLVGVSAAKAAAAALDIPFFAVDHLQAHVYACRMAEGREIYPCAALVVSGGHTSLYACRTPLDFAYLGGTIDDAAGEAFDKAAALLGLPYPGGPSIEAAAANGNHAAYPLPRPLIDEPDRLEFSFSGLKTAVRYLVQPPNGPRVAITEAMRADLAASFQEAVIDCLAAKALRAMELHELNRLSLCGGVACNQRLRTRLGEALARSGRRLLSPPPSLCTDNAAMGAVALEMMRAQQGSALDIDIKPGLRRGV